MNRRRYLKSVGILGTSSALVYSRVGRSVASTRLNVVKPRPFEPTEVTSNNLVVTIPSIKIKSDNIKNTDDPLTLLIETNTDTDSLGYTRSKSYKIDLNSKSEEFNLSSISVNVGNDGRNYQSANNVRGRIIIKHPDITTTIESFKIIDSSNKKILDNFDSCSLNSSYKGDTGAASVVSNAGIDSGCGLSMLNSGGGDFIYRTDISVSQGSRIRMLTRNEGGNNFSAGYAYYGYQSDGSHYLFGWGSEEGQARYVNANGNIDVLYRTGEILSTDTNYEFIVDWKEDGTHELIIKTQDGTEVDRGSGTNSKISSGGIGFEIGGSSGSMNHYFDGYKVI